MDIPLKSPRNTFSRRLKRQLLTLAALFALVLGIGALPVVVLYFFAHNGEEKTEAAEKNAYAETSPAGQSRAKPGNPISLNDRAVAFVNVNVVPIDKERIIVGQTVIVKAGCIAEIGPANITTPPEGALIVDGRGRYLMPGLSDMHVHFRGGEDENNAFLQLFIANGVTTVLNLYGTPQHLNLREKVAAGELLGPIIYSSGPFVNEPAYKTAEDVERAVIEQKRAGYDFIKIHGDLSREAYHHLLEVSRREAIPVVGHAPRKLGMEVLLEERQLAIAHAEEYLYAYFGFNRKYPDDPDEIKNLVQQISTATAKAETWVIPTLTIYRGIGLQVDDIDAMLARPEVKYMPPRIGRGWLPANNDYLRRFGKDSVPMFRSRYELLEKLVKGLSDANVKMVAGTDAPVPTVVPGFSLHDELKDMVAAGLTPYQAIRTATANAAEFLGVLDIAGTVSIGKRADLILVEGNPLEDVANTSRLAGVMVRGRWIAKDELRDILEGLLASYAGR